MYLHDVVLILIRYLVVGLAPIITIFFVVSLSLWLYEKFANFCSGFNIHYQTCSFTIV